jgi:hypothetical protein
VPTPAIPNALDAALRSEGPDTNGSTNSANSLSSRHTNCLFRYS